MAIYEIYNDNTGEILEVTIDPREDRRLEDVIRDYDWCDDAPALRIRLLAIWEWRG